MTRRARLTVLPVLTAGLTVLLATAGLVAPAGASAPGTTTVLHASVGPHVIRGIPTSMPAGEYTFKVHETGSAALQLGRLRDGYSRAELNRDLVAGFGSGDRAAIDRIYQQVVFEGGTGGAPDQQFTTYLTPGHYVYLNSDSLDPVRTVEVTDAGKTAPAPPSVGVTVTGGEDPSHPGHFRFDVSGQLAPSGQLRLKATGTDEPHLLDVFKLKPGATAMDCLHADGPSGPQAPCAEVFTTGILSPGQAMVLPYHLDGPGRYLLACFLPDPDQGMDHASLGMYKVVQVGT